MSERAVAEQYEQADLLSRILAALAASGRDTTRLRTDDLATVDAFHTGGRAATAMVLGEMSLEAGMRVLDAGCGIGGTARCLAADHGCIVTGIDLAASFVIAASELTRLVGLAEACRFAVASAGRLPFADRSFDAVLCIHVAMNIPDRAGLVAEFARVLRPGGELCLFDVTRSSAQPLPFPLPWAETAATSFLLGAEETRQTLELAGLRVLSSRSLRDFAIGFFDRQLQRTAPDPSMPGIHLLTGANTRDKMRNYREALAAGDLDPVIMVAQAPPGEPAEG